MKLLAVDTATEACSAALLIDDDVIARYQVAPREHTQLILPMCDALLSEAGITTAQLDAVAFGRGPGSFTGVRIAAGVAQGIAFAHDLPVLCISTLAVLAQQVVANKNATKVLACIDARMQEIYWAAYESDEQGMASLVGKEMVVPPANVQLPRGQGWHGAGSGWQSYTDILVQRMQGQLVAWDGALLPDARYMLRLAQQAYTRGEAVTADRAQPIYLRDKVANKPAKKPALSKH